MKHVLVAVVVLSVSGAVAAQEVGDRVVVVSADAAIKVGEEAVDHPPPGEDLIVREIKGDWYVVSRGWPGEIRRSDVVPFDQALAHFDRALAANRGDHASLLGRASHLADLERYDEAIKDYTVVIRLARGHSAAYVGRANCWLRKESYDNAIADYNEAVRLDPDSAIAFYDRGLAREGKREFEKAVEDYTSAIRLSPEYSLAYEMRGRARFEIGDLDEAKDDSTQALLHDPESPGAYDLRGLIRRREQMFAAAIEDFEQAIRLAPKTGGPYLAHASETFAARGAFDEQRQFLERMLESGPPDLQFDILSQLASCHRSLRDFDAALRYMEKAVDMKPTDISALYSLAIMQKNAGRVELALQTYERARDLTQSPYLRTSLDVVIAGYRIHAGKRESGLSLFNLVKADAERLGMHVNIAWFYAVAQMDEEFYPALERALDANRESALSWVRTEVDIDRYRQEQRFQDLLARYE